MTMLDRHKGLLNRKAPENPEAKKIEQAIAAVLETDPGKLLFAHLFNRCGYDRADHALNRQTGELVEDFNAKRRAVYVELRALVPKTHRKTLLEVELLAEDGWGSGNPIPQSKPAAEAEINQNK